METNGLSSWIYYPLCFRLPLDKENVKINT